MSTPYELLNQANEDYHNAAKKVLKDSDVITNIETLCDFADAARCAFVSMKRAKDLIKTYYE